MHTTEIGRDRLQGSGCVLVDRGNHSKTVPSAYAGLDEFFVEWYHIDLWWQRKHFWTILQRRIIIFENRAQTKDKSSKRNQTEWDVDRLLDLSSLSRFVGTHNIAIERLIRSLLDRTRWEMKVLLMMTRIKLNRWIS